MSSEASSWANQWGTNGGIGNYNDDGGDKHESDDKGKMMANVKLVASARLGKAEVVATAGAQKVKSGTSVGIRCCSMIMSSEVSSWTDQWGTSGHIGNYDGDGGDKHKSNNSGKKMAHVKVVASARLGKAKVVAAARGQNVKVVATARGRKVKSDGISCSNLMMNSQAPSWANKWGTSGGIGNYDDDGGEKHESNNKGKKMADVKVVASAGLSKAKVMAIAGARKVKSGMSMGISWVKNQYEKKTLK